MHQQSPTLPIKEGVGRRQATFHRFCRRGYAAFASMHREVRIGVLTVATLASVALPKVQAASPTTANADDPITVPEGSPEGDSHDLAEVAVAGTLSPLTALQSARIVSVITAQQIEASAAQTVNDILKLAVGVDVRQRGGFGIQTDISIDGGTFDQITILLNGVNISSPHTGHLTADFPVNLSDIERIEILEGAASRVYGASAFGGAINIVTKAPAALPAAPASEPAASPFPVTVPEGSPVTVPEGSPVTVPEGSPEGSPSAAVPAASPSPVTVPEGSPEGPPSAAVPAASPAGYLPPTLDAGLQGGSYGTFGADARVALIPSPQRTNPHRAAGALTPPPFISLSAAYQRSDGATTNSSFSRGNAYLRTIYDAPEFRVDLQAGYSQKSYGANTFYSAAYPNQYERNTRIITSLGAETKGRLRLRPEVYWNRLYDNFELIRGTTTGENFHRTDVHGARLTASLSWVAGRSAIGAEVREEGIYSTSLGKPITYRVPLRTAGGGSPAVPTYYTRHDSRTNLSFNAEHTLLLPRFTISAGLLGNMNTRFDNHLAFYPGIDIAYRPSSHWRLFASYNKGFRLPTFTDLYYKSPTHEGNQGMRAEESHSIQFGLHNNFQLSARLCRLAQPRTFNLQLNAKAFYHRGTNMIDWVMYSADDVYHSANFDLDNMGFSVQSSCQLSTVNCQLSYAFLHQHRRDDVEIYKSNYAMEYLRHKLVATLDHPILTIPQGRRTRRFSGGLPSPLTPHRAAGANPNAQRPSTLSASWSLRWQDRMGSYLLYRDTKSTGELVPYSPYATLNLKLRWTAPHYELWLEGTNLTNRRYYDLGNIPQPGVVILAGARLRL